MRLNNGNKIITDDDIILTGSGKTLSEEITSQQRDITELRSNVKWIYKYGGVGSGNGSGGGSSTDFSVYATIDGVQLKDQSIVLEGAGTYPLYIKINKPNGGTYNVQYSYSTISASGNVST